MTIPLKWAAGCYVDSWWGQYAPAKAWQVVRQFGYTSDDAEYVDRLAANHLAAMGPSDHALPTEDQLDTIIEALEQAEAWANDLTDGQYIGWLDGDWGVWDDAHSHDYHGDEVQA